MTYSIRDIGDWQAESCRLTVFPAEGFDIGRPDWWQQLVGEPPEVYNIQPKTGGLEQRGPYEGDQLVMVARAGRIDWVHTPLPQVDQQTDALLTIGSFPETSERFCRLLQQWIPEVSDVARLAFGAVLLLPVTDRVEGYKQLQPYLPDVRLDPEGSSDFSYQINRARDSSSGPGGLKINRLSKWSVAVVQHVTVSLGVGTAERYHGPQKFACRVEVDINTVPSGQSNLPRDRVVDIFGELVSLSREIVSSGDIA